MKKRRHRYRKEDLIQFKFLICIDFEATCWASYDRKQDAEIIEIGAVILDVDTGSIVERFQRYIRPKMFPELSDYCTNMTGITQEMIEQAEIFEPVYVAFLTWINQNILKYGLLFASPTSKRAAITGPNTTFCSWSNWDLNFYFQTELERAKISSLPCFKVWIDVRRKFNDKYAMGQCSFVDALNYALIEQEGQAHSAINDAENLSKMVMYLKADDNKFTIAYDGLHPISKKYFATDLAHTMK